MFIVSAWEITLHLWDTLLRFYVKEHHVLYLNVFLRVNPFAKDTSVKERLMLNQMFLNWGFSYVFLLQFRRPLVLQHKPLTSVGVYILISRQRWFAESIKSFDSKHLSMEFKNSSGVALKCLFRVLCDLEFTKDLRKKWYLKASRQDAGTVRPVYWSCPF